MHQAGIENLTEREEDVLRLVAGGKTNKGIGAFLGMTEHTVKAHLKCIFDKLDAENRAVAAAAARAKHP